MSGIMQLLLASRPQAVPDPYFEYTTLLLPGNGTNGAQNNTFLDSSTNNFTITRNGNTTQGTFSPFSQTGWSNYFDGTGDYLSVADNVAFTLGSGNFTVECWIYRQTSGARTYIFAQSTGTDNINTSIGAEVNASNKLVSYTCSGTTAFTATSANDIPSNQWVHVAIVRNGATVTQYINGTKDGEVSVSTSSVNDSGQIFGIGSLGSYAGLYWNGYISNFRLVKGTAVYTANFTPSTTPLTAITNTSLLTCQSNRFIDNSTNNFTITRNGDVSVQAFSPFNPTAAWSAATNGGSGYFDGSGDYLTSASGGNLGSGDFTVQFWINPSVQANYATVFGTRQGVNWYAGEWSVDLNTGGINFIFATNLTASTGVAIPNFAWTHIAFVRSGSTFKTYRNGVLAATNTNSDNYTTTAIGIGNNRNGTASPFYTGYLANVQLIPGVALYSADFTPPTSPATSTANTSLLLNFTNAGIYDATSKNDLETVGNAQISTTQSKFGGSSMYFDGTDDRLLVPTSPNLTFGTGDFTIEAWVNRSTSGSVIHFIDFRGSNNDGSNPVFYWQTNNFIYYTNNNTSGDNQIQTSNAITSSSGWVHLAIVRSGTTLTVYVNGVASGSTTYSTNVLGGNPVTIANRFNNSGAYTGYINDLRITKGYARYTTNFTPPTAAFPLF